MRTTKKKVVEEEEEEEAIKKIMYIIIKYKEEKYVNVFCVYELVNKIELNKNGDPTKSINKKHICTQRTHNTQSTQIEKY